MVEIIQGLAKLLKIKWKLHTAYRPEFRGSRTHELEPQNYLNHTLPRNTIPLDRHATIDPAQGMLYP
jgi:hypothetical protein